MQALINDPTLLLQATINQQFIESLVVLNVATIPSLDTTSGHTTVTMVAGGIENIPFLQSNAAAISSFATFWIETIKSGSTSFLQLQYVQTVILNFPIPGSTTNFSWPHVSVATLRNTGQTGD
jgi:hypothetical protein